MIPLLPRLWRWAAVLLFLLFASLHLHTAAAKSPTWDEVGYLGLGAYLLTHGEWDVPAAGSHPPLAYYLHGLPALLFPIDWSTFDRAGRATGDLAALRAADLSRGNSLLLDPRYDGELLLLLCRSASLIAAGLLAILVVRWAALLGGRHAALAALLFMALSPNILAHSPLITADFTLAALFFAAVYAIRRLLAEPGRRGALLAGLAMGAASLTKLSGLLIIPVGLALAVWKLGTDRPPEEASRGLWRRLRAGAGPSGGPPMRLWGFAAMSFAAVILVAYQLDPTPYADVIRSQLSDLSTGHRAYLMGQISDRGWWYYYPVAFAVKTPLPTLVLVSMGIASLMRRGRQSRIELGFLVIPSVVFAGAFVLSSGKDIGLRYILPAYPFLFVLAGVGVADLVRARRSWRQALAVALCAWYCTGAARIHPDHLAYFNELVGGPANGHRYLADSNLDWGQDLKQLARFLRQNRTERVKLSYFGTVDPALYGLEYEWLPSFHLPAKGRVAAPFPPTGLVAVSVTNLVGVYMGMYGASGDIYGWLRDVEPIARIGYSINVYDLPVPP